MKKNIVIVGYPKSGTTWLARLVAELVECPLVGAWDFDDVITAYKEGSDRISHFACYKSHHSYEEIITKSKSIYKIIYIIRDPRDIALSGLYYFNDSYPFLKKMLLFQPLYKFSEKLIHLLKGKNYSISHMTNMVLNGDKKINKWCGVSWKEHFKPYKENHVFFVSYEQMLKDPVNQCGLILNELNIKKSKNHILKSIEKQSFNNKKKQENTNSKLLRIGSFNYWKNELSESEKKLFVKKIGKELSTFNYDLI